jgi:alkanesulfonate monooxygenase SsuD/methylene tetrahydromethanopterin reductase-like flavin-dependent oxidoreductase (luciferase family)
VRTLHRLLAEAGRDPAQFGIAKRVFIQIGGDRARNEARLMQWFGKAYGKPEEAKTGAIYGPPAECVDKVGELVRAGGKLLILDPIFEQREQMEMLSTEVVAKF